MEDTYTQKRLFFGFSNPEIKTKTKNQTKIFGYHTFKNKRIEMVLIDSSTENLKTEVPRVKDQSVRL